MKISLYDVDYNNEIEFEDGYVLSLECENTNYFIKLINNAKGLTNDAFKVFDKDKLVDFEKDVLTIVDYYALDQYEKTLLSKFYKSLDKRYLTDSVLVGKLTELEKLFKYIANYVTEDYNASFEINMPTLISDYVKFSDLKISGGFGFGVDGILNFINALSILKTYKLLVLVNAKSFFNEVELAEIIKCCTYNNLKTLFIDVKTSRNHYQNEIKLLIDNDFYDILYK